MIGNPELQSLLLSRTEPLHNKVMDKPMILWIFVVTAVIVFMGCAGAQAQGLLFLGLAVCAVGFLLALLCLIVDNDFFKDSIILNQNR